MSKKITRWACSVCGAEYPSKEVAEQCEKDHIPIVGVRPRSYRKENRYPDVIRLDFEDGAVGLYSFGWLSERKDAETNE